MNLRDYFVLHSQSGLQHAVDCVEALDIELLIDFWLAMDNLQLLKFNFMFYNIKEKLKFEPKLAYTSELDKDLDFYFDHSFNRLNSDFLKYVSLLEMYKVDEGFLISVFKQIKNSTLLLRARDYYNFISTQKYVFKFISDVELKLNFPSISLSSISNGKVPLDLVSFEEIESTITLCFDRTDKSLIRGLKAFNTKFFDTYYVTDVFKMKLLNNTALLHPILLGEFPEQKLIYLKSIKMYVQYLLEYRREFFDPIPSMYNSALTFIESIDLAILETTKPIQGEIALPKVESKMASPTDYPKHIFSDAAAFAFFDFLVQKCTKTVQVVFLYRQMIEKENPPKIITKYSPFRLWFEKHYKDLDIVLIDKPQTYEMSKTDDRLLLYETAKELFQELQNQ